MRSSPVRWLAAGLMLFVTMRNGPAQQPRTDPLDEELARQQQIGGRFVTVLERTPRRGTALDRIYGFHVENGTLEAFVADLRERTAKTPGDGVGWMVLGLIESQRGRDAAAVEALTKAKELRPTDAMAAYYLGQSLVLVGQPDQAAVAFEEAIARKPPQADLLDVFQALGRLHQRAQRTTDALAVWSRLEKLFPNDPRVQEQIALSLVEEGQAAEALPRYEALAKATTDEYRRTTYRVEAAELKVKLNRASEAIADLESLIAKLNPDSWLFREVRRKIEDVFLRTGDQEGLAKYYAGWLAKNAEDVDAMARLSRVLARQGRVNEAQPWLDKALKLAPSRRDLRLAFIEQLTDDQRFADAIQQYVALDKAEPNNPDVLRDWGKLILRDASRPKAERQAEAQRVWQRMLAARPTDPLVATQVADLLRHAEFGDAALALYIKAVELAPTQPQYREFLGEYYHLLKRPVEAQATWRQIAEGKLRTAANLTRLAEVLAEFGYLKEALPEIAAAAALDPKDLSLQLKAADLQIRGEQYDAALVSLVRAEALAQNDDEREAILVQRLKTYTQQNKLAILAGQLAQETAKGNATNVQPAARIAAQWFLLARYREALREWPDATRAINEALAAQPNHVPSLAAAARIAEQSGDLKVSADMNRKLAVVDRRSRSVYLQHVAQLETQLGRIDEALAAGRELLAATPGNVETYQFFADLCFRLGRVEEGLTALRRAARANPNEPSILLSLAAALAGQFRSDEAIELYWQAFEKGSSLDDKLSVVSKLTELYLQTNHLDELLERLERGRREDDRRREMTICLAQAYHAAGDYGMARQELERLLSENTRDTQLLLQLSKLAESESDLAAAVKYQEQLARLAPSAETEFRLATLLARTGDTEKAAAIFIRLAGKEQDLERLLKQLDGLLNSGQETTALAVLEKRLAQHADNWELLYRHGIALAKTNPTEASERFRALLRVSLSDDELGVVAKNLLKGPGTARAATLTSGMISSRFTSVTIIRFLARLEDTRSSPGLTAQVANWRPADFGQARMAAIAWIFRLTTDGVEASRFIATLTQRARAEDATLRELWDGAYLHGLLLEQADLRRLSRQLAERGGRMEQQLYLTQIYQMQAERQQQTVVVNGTPMVQQVGPVPVLAADDLELALHCYRELRAAELQGGSQQSLLAPHLTLAVLSQLQRANRTEEADEIYRDVIQGAESPTALSQALQLASQRDDRETFLKLFARWAAKDVETPASTTASRVSAQTTLALIAGELSKPRATAEDICGLLDRFLAYQSAKSNRALTDRRPQPAALVVPAGLPPGVIPVLVNGRMTYRQVTPSGNSPLAPRLASLGPSRHFDALAIQVLQFANEALASKGARNGLVAHLTDRATAAPAAEKLIVLLALTHAQGWQGNHASAISTLKQAAEVLPQDLGLRLDVARLHVQARQFAEALAAVDAVTPTDQDELQQRELLALDIALQLKNQERGRQAAQRLFGMRLSPATQMSLATKMRQLGLSAEADAVLARTRRRSGDNPSTLAALMRRYQSEGKPEVAAEVAYQILRRTRTQRGTAATTTARPAPAPAASVPTSSSAAAAAAASQQARQQALTFLGQSGRLKDLIAGLEEQVERSPHVTQLVESLAEYYQAAGETQKLQDLQERLLALRAVESGESRLQYALEMRQRGKLDLACEQFGILLAQDPQLAMTRSSVVVLTFRQTDRLDELVKIVSGMELRALGPPLTAIDLVRELADSPERLTAHQELFHKAWRTFPADRARLVTGLTHSGNWSRPDLQKVAQKLLLPSADDAAREPWYGASAGLLGTDMQGDMHDVGQLLLTGIDDAGHIAEFRERAAKVAADSPAWLGGPVLLALIDLRQQKNSPIDAAALEARLRSLLSAAGNEPALRQTRWVMAQQLEQRAELRPLAVRMYDAATRPDGRHPQPFKPGPAPRLVKLLREGGRTDEARLVLMRAAHEQFSGIVADSQSLRRAREALAIATELRSTNEPAAALQLYRGLRTSAELAAAIPAGDRAVTSFWQDVDSRYAAVLKEALDQPRAEFALALLRPVNPTDEGRPAIDLLIGWKPTNALLSELESPIAGLLRPAALTELELAPVAARLAELQARHPRDASVAIAAALFALAGPDASQARTAVTELGRIVAAKPPADADADLWLVARECLQEPALAQVGGELAERALAFVRRASDRSRLAGFLLDLGRLALKRGDRPAAERAWNELINVALVEPRQPRPIAAAVTVHNRPTAMATQAQLALAALLADEALRGDLPALSLRTLREVLSGGLPPANQLASTQVDPFLPSGVVRAPSVVVGNSPLPLERVASISGTQEQFIREVCVRLEQFSLRWQERRLPADEVCLLLESIVFPAARPKEIALYSQPLTQTLTRPQSIGQLLVEWSLRAGRADALRQQVAARQAGGAADAIAGRVLLTQLGVAERNTERAREQLRALVQDTQPPKSTTIHELAVHAAAAALDDPELVADALPLLDRWVAVRGPLSLRSPLADTDPLATLLLRLHIQSGDLATAQRHVQRSIQSIELPAAVAGETTNYVRRRNLAWGANELARAGDLATTLASLGQFVAGTTAGEREAAVNVALWHLARQAQALPATQRYERLRDWTLPGPPRRDLRVVLGFDAGQPIPTAFQETPRSTYQPQPPKGPLSNLTMLVEAATQANRLEELQQAVEPLAEGKSFGAKSLAILTLIARGQVAEVRPRLEAIEKRIRIVMPADSDRRPAAPESGDYLVAHAALHHPELADAGLRLADLVREQAWRSGHQQVAAHLAHDLAERHLTGLSPTEHSAARNASLAYWLIGNAAPPSGAWPSALWAIHDGHLVHRAGGETDALFGKIPLAGEFELSFEVLGGGDAQCHLGYGGPTCQITPRSDWSRLRLAVSSGAAKYYVNGSLILEELASAASPWLVLQAAGSLPLAVRNLRLSGQPSIPRLVNLVPDNRLAGWNRQFYFEEGNFQPSQTRPAPISDWHAASGELVGRMRAAAGRNAANWIAYQRPLADGERVRWQFRYEAGRVIVHPTLGRLAFLLQPEGVRLHWLTRDGGLTDVVLASTRNRVDEPASRRGPSRLPLKDGDWNDLELALAGDVVSIALNGELVCQRPIEPAGDCRFGLFHFNGETEARVRDLTLTGNWPQTLPAAKALDLLTLNPPEAAAAVRRARHALVSEDILGNNAYGVWQQARGLPPRERLALLQSWVLPSDSHPTFRLRFDWTPSHGTDGTLVAPALELLAVAKQLGQLGSVAGAVARAKRELPAQLRQALAIETLIAVSSGDDAAATEGLAEFVELLKGMPMESSVSARCETFLTAHAALSRPALWSGAAALATRLVAECKLDSSLDADWQRRVRRLQAEVEMAKSAAQQPRVATDASGVLWRPTWLPTAAERGAGFPAPLWRVTHNSATWLSGGGRDVLFFAVPLTGDFEVRCRRPLATWREMRVLYGGVLPELTADVAALRNLESADAATAAEYRLVVEGGVLRTLVNGQETHSSPLPNGIDPWLTIEARQPSNAASLDEICILGRPTIPREVHLSASTELAGWSADCYEERLVAPNRVVAWTKNGDEIIGRSLNAVPSSFRESLLQYRRPLWDDGTLEYEFFYEPGKLEVHLALDRLAFLLAPEGVRLHRLTDAQHDRTGIAPNNTEPLTDSRPVPLKAGQWNQLVLTLKSDESTIAVNGVSIARHKLESSNSRTFGLFRYSNATSVRVRNVIHHGQWPTSLPSKDTR